MRFALLLALLATPAFAEDDQASDLPEIATEIVIEDLNLSVKRARIGLALSPEDIERLVTVLRRSGATVAVESKVEEKD